MTSLTIVLLMLSLQAVMGSSLRDLEDPKKCSLPKKFEGKVKTNVEIHQRHAATITGSIHVDDTIARAAILQTFLNGGKTTEINTYFINNNTYEAKPAMRVCGKTSVAPSLPGEVPPRVTPRIKNGELQGVPVQIWEYNRTEGKGNLTVTQYFTKDTCMPMKVVVEVQSGGRRALYAVQDYSDMKEGIKDASVLNLPKYCVKQSNSHRMPQLANLHIQQAIARYEPSSQPLA